MMNKCSDHCMGTVFCRRNCGWYWSQTTSPFQRLNRFIMRTGYNLFLLNIVSCAFSMENQPTCDFCIDNCLPHLSCCSINHQNSAYSCCSSKFYSVQSISRYPVKHKFTEWNLWLNSWIAVALSIRTQSIIFDRVIKCRYLWLCCIKVKSVERW